MARGRRKHGYLLFDLPSDHEIEEGLSTECEVIRAIVVNKDGENRVKTIRVATPESFISYPLYKYQVQYVHLACHGGPLGIGMIGSQVKWSQVTKQIKRHLKPLTSSRQRVLCLSCCYSYDGFRKTKSALQGYFTGAYHFALEEIDFATSMATWVMFYNKKTLSKPHQKIVDDINTFFDKKVISFRTY